MLKAALFSIIFASPMAMAVDNSLPIMGSGQIRIVKPLHLPEVPSGPNDGFSWLFSVKDGKIQARVNDGGPKPAGEMPCVLLVQYSDDDINQMGRTGKFHALDVKSDFSVDQGVFEANGEVGKPPKVSLINLDINQVTVSTMGSPLFYLNGHASQTRAYRINCRGEDLRLSDLFYSFGGNFFVQSWK